MATCFFRILNEIQSISRCIESSMLNDTFTIGSTPLLHLDSLEYAGGSPVAAEYVGSSPSPSSLVDAGR